MQPEEHAGSTFRKAGHGTGMEAANVILIPPVSREPHDGLVLREGLDPDPGRPGVFDLTVERQTQGTLAPERRTFESTIDRVDQCQETIGTKNGHVC